MALKDLISDFLEYLEIERNRSIRTVENYRHYLNRLSAFSKITKPEQINDDLIRKFRLHLNRFQDNHGEPLKKVTQNYHIIAIRSFLKYLAKRDIKTMSAEKVELAKQEERQVTFLESHELERFLKSPVGNDLQSLRDRAILETLFSTGLRVSELCSLNKDQIDLKRGEFTVRGKGRKLRVVFLSDTARTTIKSYSDQRKDIDEALFIRIPPKEAFEKYDKLRLTPRSIQRIIKKYAVKTGIIGKKVSPHTMRHCLHQNTRIFLGDEICSALELFKNRNTFVKSMDFNHSTMNNFKVSQKFTHKTDKLLSIWADGHELICTPEHRLFTIGKNGIMEIAAKDIKLGNHLAGVEYIKQEGRQFLKTEIWRILGYVLGDGIISERFRGVKIYDKDREFLKFYQNLFTKHFHKEPFLRELNPNSFELIFYSNAMVKYLRQYIPVGNAPTKRVPWQLFQATDKEIVAFITGFYDAEGNSGRIKIFSSSKELLKDIQALFLRLGIDSHVLRRRRKVKLPQGKIIDNTIYTLHVLDRESQLKFKRLIKTLKKHIILM